jgi:hypothetical protein
VFKRPYPVRSGGPEHVAQLGFATSDEVTEARSSAAHVLQRMFDLSL